MSNIDLEHGIIGDRRLSSFTDGHEDFVSCFHSDTYGSSRSISSVSSDDEAEKRLCRICQLDVGSYGQGLIELGCSCKDDLAFAHRQCAETWFKLKGNYICEICHSEARNVASGNEVIEEDDVVVVVVVDEGEGEADAAMGENGESSCLWQGLLVLIIVLVWWMSFMFSS